MADALGGEGLLERLVGFHLNDCKGAVGCRRDRHEVPGEGSIGHGLVSIARHPAFRGLPVIHVQRAPPPAPPIGLALACIAQHPLRMPLSSFLLEPRALTWE